MEGSAAGAKRKHRLSDASPHDLRPHKKPHHQDYPPTFTDDPASSLSPQVALAANGDGAMEIENGDLDIDSEMDEEDMQRMLGSMMAPRLKPGVAATDTAEWQRTIEKVVRNVVSIRFCQTCSFDTDEAITSEATGFVVDAERGYILTNRHVVCAGPFWGYCVFDNHEEVGNPVEEVVRNWADDCGWV